MQPAGGGRIVLRKGRDARVKAGHLWVYAGEIEKASDGLSPGDTAEVVDHRGRFLARGYYNPASTISVRLLTRRRDEVPDAALLRRRIALAVAYRRQFYAAGESCRLIFSEGDMLPGLTVDRYGPFLSVQIATLGMDRLRDDIVAALKDAVHPRGIYERSDLPARLREGLQARTGVLDGEIPDEVEVLLDDLKFLVPLRSGQKTGLFLDQRFNRRALQPHARGRRALDVFCNTGSFGLYALAAGAERGYKEINLRAFRLAAPGAVVATSSCSYHLGPEEFLEVVRDAAADAGREVTLVDLRGQAPDHPVNLAVPETRYLKFAILM